MNANEAEIRALHGRLLAAWNARDAKAFGDQFTEDGEQVGYDGSQVAGAAVITDNIGQIFADHPTARYLALVRSVRFVTAEVAVLRAEVGMVPPGGDDINPDRNAVQSLVAVAGPDGWRLLDWAEPQQIWSRSLDLLPQNFPKQCARTSKSFSRHHSG